MQDIIINDKDLFIMNLVHYFITEQNYNPVIIHGIDDEIWLENMDSDYKIIRIVSHHIHNNEQLGFDKFKLNQIVKKLKLKTLSFKMNVLNIYTDLGDNVSLQDEDVFIPTEEDIKNDSLVKKFPDIVEKTEHDDNGINFFLKITDNINSTTSKKNRVADKIFSRKYPLITYILMGINILIFLFMLFGNYEDIMLKYGMYTPYVKMGEYYRLFTCMLLHANFIHFLSNMYALYVIGPQVESFFGKGKYLFIYLVGGLCGSVLSMTFSQTSLSVGASGAIFALLGALLYFGNHYRTYLGSVIKSQVLPIVILNLGLGFMLSGIDNFAHVGGLLGGMLSAMIMGIPEQESKTDRINGIVILLIALTFLCYLTFCR